jgi:hypothetical protein
LPLIWILLPSETSLLLVQSTLQRASCQASPPQPPRTTAGVCCCSEASTRDHYTHLSKPPDWLTAALLAVAYSLLVMQKAHILGITLIPRPSRNLFPSHLVLALCCDVCVCVCLVERMISAMLCSLVLPGGGLVTTGCTSASSRTSIRLQCRL